MEIKLLSPLTVRGITIRNRIAISPMCQYSAHEGYLENWHLINLGRFVMGGAGLIFTEATAVQKNGRITHGCPGLWNEGQVAIHSQVTNFAIQYGSIPAIQLAHAGPKSGMQRPWFGNSYLGEEDMLRGDMPWTPVGPSTLPVAKGWSVPHAITVPEINDIIDDFVSAAGRALRAGYKILEIHGAHGYLIHSFLSPLTNKRTDAYGGSLQKRMRLALDIPSAVRAIMPDDIPLFFRISAIDGVKGGWTLDDSVVLSRLLASLGVDVIDCSSGGINGSATATKNSKKEPGFQVPYASYVRSQAEIPTMTVGLITHPVQAEKILLERHADLIAIGREALVNPNWPLKAAQTLGVKYPFNQLPPQAAWWLEKRLENSSFYIADKLEG